LWFGVHIAIAFFFLTLGFDDIAYDKEFEFDAWTHHPLLSIFRVRNGIFTGKTRAALMWMNIVTISVVASIAVPPNTASPPNGGQIIEYMLVSVALGILWTYI